MKTLAAVLLLAWTIPAAGQQTEIVGFKTNGVITWTNEITNAYCGVEWTMDLQWCWLPWTWNIASTGSVATARLDVAVLDNIDWSVSPELERRKNSHFFRIVAATAWLPNPVLTNSVRLCNCGASILTNISIGVRQSHVETEITNIPSLLPSSCSPYIPVAEEFHDADWSTMACLCSGQDSDGWYVSYDHDGTNREYGFSIIFVGPPEKGITLAVSNAAVRMDVEWLGIGTTWKY
jgi:hypothetical protein